MTSTDMQPASANASVWTGDGPDWLSPSIVIELFGLFDDKANLSPSFHARSTTVGGFEGTEEILPIHVFFENHYALRHQNAHTSWCVHRSARHGMCGRGD